MRSTALPLSLLLHGFVIAGACAWRGMAHQAFIAPGSEGTTSISFIEIEVPADQPNPDMASVEPALPPVAEPPDRTIELLAASATQAAEPLASTPMAALSVNATLATARRGAPGRGKARSGRAGGMRSLDYAPPRYLTCPAPAYPAAARAGRLEGAALLRVAVDRDGRPTSITIERSTGSALLDEAAIAAVRRWRFTTARADGIAIAANVEVPIRFRFHGA